MRDSVLLLFFLTLLLLPDGRKLWQQGWQRELGVMVLLTLTAWLLANTIIFGWAEPVVDSFFTLLPENL
ncbi:MAG: hypothetical protein ACOY3H_08020 [Bacillota bacterium]